MQWGRFFHRNHPQRHQSAQATEHKPAGTGHEERLADYTYWLTVLTGILAASTVGLWIVTGFGVRNQTKDTRVLQRAYVAVEGGGIDPLDLESVAHIEVRNVGNLPARDVSWFIDWAIDNNGQRNVFPIDETRFFGRNVIPPGTIMKRSQTCQFNDRQEIMSLEEGVAHFYVWGEIRYLDGFGERRFTKFCHRYGQSGLIQNYTTFPNSVAQSVVAQALSAGSMRYHQHGNDAD